MSSEFIYESMDVDFWGHKRYKCTCSVCGAICYYGKKVNHAPRCAECSRKIGAKEWYHRKKFLQQKAAYTDCLIQYQELDREEFEDWLIRKVEEND